MADQNKPKNTFEAIVDVIFNADCRQLLGGLTVLAKDLSEFLAVNAYYGADTQRFMEVFAATLNANRHFWSSLGDVEEGEERPALLYRPLEQTGMPHGFAKTATLKTFDIKPLLEKNVNQEWTRHPGWALLLAFREASRDLLWGTGGVVRQFLDTNGDDKKKLAKDIAEALAKNRFSEAAHWRPFLAQLGVVLAKVEGENR
jgi:hypothetical protein